MLYFCRHGETLYNRQNRWIGQRDIELSPKGEAHIHQVAKKLSSVQFDEILSSPLSRALRTAEIIAQKQLAPPPLCLQPWLAERGYGVLEGLGKTEDQRQKLDEFEGVEPASAFGDRLSAIDKLDFRSRNILLVSHSGVFKYLVANWRFSCSSLPDHIGHGEVIVLGSFASRC